MRGIKGKKRNSVVTYSIMLFLIIWSSFMFLGIQLAINMLFANLFLMSKFIGFLGIVLYLPFMFLCLLLIFPFYLLFKKIYNIVVRSSISFKSNRINLFFLIVIYYGIPILFSVIIANRVLENYESETFAHKSVIIILSIAMILMLDYVCGKILKTKLFKTNPKLKLNN